MNYLIIISQLLPLLGVLAIWLSNGTEKQISNISFIISRLMGATFFVMISLWLYQGAIPFEYHWFTLYEEPEYSFPVLFYLDINTIAYLFCIWTIFTVILKYCRVYLHRETGYKRFFQTIFGFLLGLNVIIMAGSIDMLFAGWEIVGISSFLLIAFYRHRPQPVRNALRAYTIYRFCDVGLLVGAWMSHSLFHESTYFSQLNILFEHIELSSGQLTTLWILSSLIILAASGKSAQFPFCFWLPRAMEGPTPSSAIFYGALSIHLGVFLLLRTQPIWEQLWFSRLTLFAIGAITIVIASISEKTQSNIKGQIAYASITQVGFMFIELAFGLEHWVLIHFLGNAFLRCYQLLVSPSIVSHLIRMETKLDKNFYSRPIKPSFLPASIRESLPEVIQNTLYVFSLQEAQLELWVKLLLWNPLKKLGHRLNNVRLLFQMIFFFCLLLLTTVKTSLSSSLLLSGVISTGMLMFSLGAFSQNQNPYRVWNDVAMSSLLACVSVWFINNDSIDDVAIFLSGIAPSWLLGIITLAAMLKNEHFKDLPFNYRAKSETHPIQSMLLFLSFLGMAGFPITPAFVGEDLLLNHATKEYPFFAIPITLAFVLNGISMARVFLRICMGKPNELLPH